MTRPAAVLLGIEVIELQRRYSPQGALVAMLPRFGRVSVVKVEVDEDRRGAGLFRRVMGELCVWADSGSHVLGATPSDTWGADVDRMTKFLLSLGFSANPCDGEPDTLIRQPGPERRKALRQKDFSQSNSF